MVYSHKRKKELRDIDTTLGSNWNQFRYLFGNIGAFGIYPFQIYDSYNYMNDYLKNKNLSWNDLKYPTLTKGSGSASSAWNFNVRAAENLYSDYQSYEKGRNNALRNYPIPRGGRKSY